MAIEVSGAQNQIGIINYGIITDHIYIHTYIYIHWNKFIIIGIIESVDIIINQHGLKSLL